MFGKYNLSFSFLQQSGRFYLRKLRNLTFLNTFFLTQRYIVSRKGADDIEILGLASRRGAKDAKKIY